MLRNILLTIAYDGTNFSGWQRQPERRTAQGELERVLSKLCAQNVELNGASRTDAGVHALGQRANFIGDFAIPAERIPKAASELLSGGQNRLQIGDARVLAAEEVPLDFHARFRARGKKYLYLINNAEPDIFSRNREYFVREKLDLDRMREAAAYIVGTYDFKCFQAAGGEEKKTTVRSVHSLDIYDITAERSFFGAAPALPACEKPGAAKAREARENAPAAPKNIAIEISGDGFLYNMVRIIAGTLVEVGSGKRSPESVAAAIDSKDRRNSGHTAPPQGLYLAEVYY